MRDTADLSADLLHWYDGHARPMPWRIPPHDSKAGIRPDPYHIWLSEVMLQQTTVAAVKAYFLRFIERWPTVGDLAAAQDADVMAAWAGLGYYARARNLLKCARVVTDSHDGLFPGSQDALQTLPGIGPYTAAAIASIAFDQRATVLDGNVERVMARLFDVRAPLPGSKEMLRAHASRITPEVRPGDYAQAVMDLGATLCSPRNPACGLCPWRADCRGLAAGSHLDLPAKTPKKPKPHRKGMAYLARRPDGALLLETRPEKGLLGGMLCLPGTDWTETQPDPAPPVTAEWRISPASVRHTFTHFSLTLDISVAELDSHTQPQRGFFKPAQDIKEDDLPTVMRKALVLGLSMLNAETGG